jgi:hypothetical protein
MGAKKTLHSSDDKNTIYNSESPSSSELSKKLMSSEM